MKAFWMFLVALAFTFIASAASAQTHDTYSYSSEGIDYSCSSDGICSASGALFPTDRMDAGMADAGVGMFESEVRNRVELETLALRGQLADETDYANRNSDIAGHNARVASVFHTALFVLLGLLLVRALKRRLDPILRGLAMVEEKTIKIGPFGILVQACERQADRYHVILIERQVMMVEGKLYVATGRVTDQELILRLRIWPEELDHCRLADLPDLHDRVARYVVARGVEEVMPAQEEIPAQDSMN